MDNHKEFLTKIQQRDPELVLKMVKCVISAHKRKRPSITIFDVTFKDTSSLSFQMQKKEYTEFLLSCMQDMINIEEYEICSEIKKITTRKTTKKLTTDNKD